MDKPIKVIDIELSSQLHDIEGLYNYDTLKVLVRLYGEPIGYVTMPLQKDNCSTTDLIMTILDQHSSSIIHHLLRNRLERPLEPGRFSIENLAQSSPLVYKGQQPLVTVAVCTRDRTDDLAPCLDALKKLDYPSLDLLVVDNAPKDNATERLVRTHYPDVRYVCEPRPGLDWARNRAIIEARGEIIAYTDDDVVVDPGWISSLARVFMENPEVMAVTGLVVPYELETEAQILFEMYGGFGRGFERKWYHLEETCHIGAGAFGTGANMAFRRCLFDKIGGLDPALDVGTVTNGGGDLEIFFRVLKEGYTLVYEPKAIVHHRHRRDYSRLKIQLTNNGIGFYSYLVRSALAYPSERLAIIRFGIWWIWWWNIRRLLKSLIQSKFFPRDLILAELKGSFIGLIRYFSARRHAKRIANNFAAFKKAPDHEKLMPLKEPKREVTEPVLNQAKQRGFGKGVWLMKRYFSFTNPTAIRTIDLSQPLCSLTDVTNYSSVRIFVSWRDRLLGRVDFYNYRKPISKSRLRDAIVDRLALRLFVPGHNLNKADNWDKMLTALTECYLPNNNKPEMLPPDISVSVVVATRDRPYELRDCLRCLLAQVTSRLVEIVVVDNNPISGLTPPVVTEFPGVILVTEQRKGLSYARNKGIITSNGDIVVSVDDDVTMPVNWLEKLITPFTQSEIMVVTGNVLPLELETKAQQLFEEYGGLGRGFEPKEINRNWFEGFRYSAVPTWELGATSNAAFRTSIFNHPQVGMMDEALGAGMPTGCSEDTYLFYKVIKAGYTLKYEPNAYVWHKHRHDLPELRRQIYNYSKGHVAYHLTTIFRDHDLRALIRLVVELPLIHLWRIKQRMRGWSNYPLSLSLLEIVGNLVGPLALWHSRRHIKCEGRSGPYVPVSQRQDVSQGFSSSDDSQQNAEVYQTTLISVS
jgi:O-antigen biosynthesis protein